jgi:uncharacterized membrane protein YhaH (DUF805 family)
MKYYLAVLNKYAVFTGRANRSEYWYYTLFSIIFSIVASMIDNALNLKFGTGLTNSGVVSSLYSLALFIPGLAVSVRRLHDVEKSGWYLLLVLLPIIGWIWLLVLYCTEGTRGTNQYGYDPNQPEGYDEIEQIGVAE